MIRRDIQLGDGAEQWLIVSQIEHARLSGELARHCSVSLSEELSAESLAPIQDEVLQAIFHHDDGWLEWDFCPGLDPASGRPLSFREMELKDSLHLWTRSIDRVARIGPLAAWMVATHFVELLEGSTREHDRTLQAEWLQAMEVQRPEWFAKWQAQNPQVHTAKLANQALVHLKVFDVLSLWLSLHVPMADESATEPPSPYRIGEDTPLHAELNATAPVSGPTWRVQVEPWIFDEPDFKLEATGMIVPIQAYRDGGELLAAGKEYRLSWTVVEI